MPKPVSLPSYRLHKATGQAIVVIRGRMTYLGKFGSTASKAEYARIMAEHLARGSEPPPPGSADSASPSVTVDEVLVRYWKWAETHYSRDGVKGLELDNIKHAIRPLRKLYGHTPAKNFGPLALKALRKSMIDSGLARNTINARVGKIRRVFKWAVAEELVPPSVFHGLQAVGGIGRGREGVKDSKPVLSVEADQVEAILPFVSKPVAAMIRVQHLTGMRPGEVMGMKVGQVDRAGDVWIFRPGRHKTQDKGFSRSIPIGPLAQEVLGPWLAGDPDAFVFSPRVAVAIRNAESRAGRKSPMTPSQAARKPLEDPKRPATERYGKRSYHRAIERACDRAFPHPALSGVPADELTESQSAELLEWRKAHRWHPNRLRHAAATRIRKAYDLESAQVVLGHAKADVTQVYAERDLGKAIEVMREIG